MFIFVGKFTIKVMNLRKQLTDLRQLLKLSRRKISIESGISESMLNEYESGRKDMTGKKIESFADCLGKKVILIDKEL